MNGGVGQKKQLKNEEVTDEGGKVESKIPTPDVKWDCTVATNEGAELPTLTVGDLFILKCQGNYLEEFSGPYKFFQYSKDGHPMEYGLNHLGTMVLNETDLTFVVTSYRPGKYKEATFYIKSSDHKLMQISSVNFEVHSVIDKNQKQPPKPFGPVGPVGLSMPWWFWGSIIGSVLIIFLLAGLKIKKRWDRKKLKEELARHGTALSPFHQMNKDLRKISRELGFYTDESFPEGVGRKSIEKIETEFRLFIIRELTIPALQWKDKSILKEIKKYHGRVFLERGVEIERLLDEFAKARRADRPVSLTDCRQFLEISRVVSEGIYQVTSKKSEVKGD